MNHIGSNKMNIDEISKLAQSCFESNPTLVLGSGISMPHGLPSMEDLKQFLAKTIKTDGEAEENAWLQVRNAMSQGDHLEVALEGETLPNSLIEKIVQETWMCMNEKDHALFLQAVDENTKFPLGELLKAQFHSSHNEINVVTTNYDRVVEYACNAKGIVHATGFTPGYYQHREGADEVRIHRGLKLAQTVRVWKVHGSLDWFSRADGTTIGMPVFELPGNGLIPQIVTPGLNKFEKTHQEPFRSTIAGADISLEKAYGYLCIGFGFRDPQIEPKLIERCRQESVPVTVLARTLSDEAKKFLRENAGNKYLGLEKSDSGSKVYTASYPDGIEINEPDLWSLDGFLKLIT